MSILTEKQKLLVTLAINKNDPLLTNDPVVNWAVDNHMHDSFLPYDEQLYTEEIQVWRNTGGWLLAWVL